jgi:hypothetical protein
MLPAGYLDPSVESTVEMPVEAELYPRVPPVWPVTVLQQYANSPRLLGMISSFAAALDADAMTEAFLDSVWNIDTAVGYGLDVWGRIVDVRRGLYVPGGQTGKTFGFGEAGGPLVFGFGQQPFASVQTSTPNFLLADADYRRLILVKAFSNISDRSIPTMNRALMLMFAGRGGNVSVVDYGGMKMAITFPFQPTALDLAILQQSGAFPAPSGVQLSVNVLNVHHVLGFGEAGENVGSFATGAFNH